MLQENKNLCFWNNLASQHRKGIYSNWMVCQRISKGLQKIMSCSRPGVLLGSMIMSRHGSLGFCRGLALAAGSEHSYSGLGIGSDPEREREPKVSRGKRPGAYTPPPPPPSTWSPGTILAKMFEIAGEQV